MITKKGIFGALKWKFLERITSQIVTFIVTLLLARFLTPTDYGVVAIITVFINLATVFVQGGFNTALIQKKDSDSIDFSSIAFFSLFIAGILYIVLFCSAPVIANFYNKNELIKLIRVLAIVLFVQAINSIQVAYITKKLKFELLFRANVIANLLSGSIGIIMAILGLGAWALVTQQILCQIFVCIVLFLTTDWRLTFEFSFERLRVLVPFGTKVLSQNLLVSLFLQIRTLFVGKVYQANQLAYFEKGKQFPQTLTDAINGTIQTVMLPVFSHEQDNRIQIKNIIRNSIQMGYFIVCPLLVGLIVIAKPMILILLTEKWLPCVFYLQCFAISYMLHPIQIVPAQALKGIGDANTVLKIEIVRKIIELILLIISINISVEAVALSNLLSSFIGVIIVMPINKKKFDYKYGEQIIDIGVPLIMSLIMGGSCVAIGRIFFNNYIKIIIEIITGVIIYIAIAIVTRNESFKKIILTVKGEK